MKPREPRIVGEELKKLARRLNRPNRFLVMNAFRIDEHLVQIENGVADIRQSLLVRRRRHCVFGIHTSPCSVPSLSPVLERNYDVSSTGQWIHRSRSEYPVLQTGQNKRSSDTTNGTPC